MSRKTKIAFWSVVAAQVIFLLVFIGVKENALRAGTELILRALPVDPRSPLQGDYATLDYEIGRLPAYMDDIPPGEPVYVSLAPGPEVWTAADYRVSGTKPDEAEVYIKGKMASAGRLDFNIGADFVPEGTGHIIEQAADIRVVVKISSGGDAIIKQVLLGEAPFNPNVRRR